VKVKTCVPPSGTSTKKDQIRRPETVASNASGELGYACTSLLLFLPRGSGALEIELKSFPFPHSTTCFIRRLPFLEVAVRTHLYTQLGIGMVRVAPPRPPRRSKGNAPRRFFRASALRLPRGNFSPFVRPVFSD